ncbi:CREB-regulated transcription coactivator 1-like isoform X2 [Limulus polyphemus]|uniref:CREB-regulated transcription coactivator 1-like isoform X2 n=1 Tax=Limulus polyphemus TaxID=6850 RepID=A0ABM1SLS7_LIMPO|nr:CREB-regulated transcription coactivator 1-like isoform X2 [Limulus polyphemus]
MASPRKFSEKIALHNQKQAKETAEFDQVMRDVLGAKRGVFQKQQILINQALGGYRVGSLPNVNQGAGVRLEDAKQGNDLLNERTYIDRSRQLISSGSRPVGYEKQLNDLMFTSGGQVHLSIPPDTNWRRTNSDSALHHSAIYFPDNSPGISIPMTSKYDTSDEMDSMQMASNYLDPKKAEENVFPQLSQSLPKSSEMPAVDIYPLENEDSMMHIALPSNTGSLPDLTNLQCLSPLAAPNDMEDRRISSSSSLQNSTQAFIGNCPFPFFPQQQLTQVIGLVPSSINVEPGREQGSSQHSNCGPSPSPSSRHHHHYGQNILGMVGSSSRSHSHQHGFHTLKQQLRYNQPTRHDLMQMTMEGLTKGTRGLSLSNYSQKPELDVYSQKDPYLMSHQTSGNQIGMLCQNSVGLQNSRIPADHSCSAPASPIAHSFPTVEYSELGYNLSLSKNPFTDSDYHFQQHHQQTRSPQQQLEQIDMFNKTSDQGKHLPMFADSTSPGFGTNQISHATSVAGYVDTPVESGDNSAEDMEGTTFPFPDFFTQDLICNPNSLDMALEFYDMDSSCPGSELQSPSFLSTSNAVSSNFNTTHTPTSIPDIVLTAPRGEESLMKQDFVNDPSSALAMSGCFDNDFLPAEEALRAGLDPIDFDGLQILTDPDISVITDPAMEETFRLDFS